MKTLKAERKDPKSKKSLRPFMPRKIPDVSSRCAGADNRSEPPSSSIILDISFLEPETPQKPLHLGATEVGIDLSIFSEPPEPGPRHFTLRDAVSADDLAILDGIAQS